MPPKNTPEPSADFQELVNLQAVHSDAANRLAEIEAEAGAQFLLILDEHRDEYGKLQGAIQQAEAALRVLALKHPEWFGAKRSVKTPYGTVKLHSGSKLVVENEEVSILLIERDADKLGLAGEAFIREKKELNLEALENIDDAKLKAFRIIRTPTESFSVLPAKVDMGKAAEPKKEAA